ncbi:hypothetical protein Tco_0755941 [Tanacetum coccineum]
MLIQQDIYAACSETHPPMLNKENYVSWSSRLLRYAKSRPNGKLIYNSIMNGLYVRRMIPDPGGPDREVPVNETFHEQTYDELTKKELKQVEANHQAIQTILLGLPEDIYAVKKAKLFNEWERFTSTDGESIESYYHRFSRLMNDFKRNKHFLEKIASNLKFLNNLQLEWSRHVTIVHQTKNLHKADYTQLYYFLKYNQKEADCSTKYEYGLRQTDADGWRSQVVQNAIQNSGVQNVRNQNRLIVVMGIANQNPNGKDQLDLDEIEEVNANCILMANLHQASTSEEQYTKLLEPIPEPHQVPQNDSNVISESREELYFSNASKTANVSKSISIPNEEFSDDTTPSVARKFLNAVKSTIVTLQRVVKQKITLDIHNWSSNVHQEIHKIVKDEIFPIVNQVDARVQNFKIQFLKEAAKFVRDFKSLAKEADESLAKHKALELEIERLLRAIFSQDIMSIVQNNSVVDTSNLQTELDRTKERFENCIIKKENEYAKLWNDWYKKYEECKYDKISYDKAYNDMQQKIKRLQAQLGDLKGKSKDTSCVSNTLDPLS